MSRKTTPCRTARIRPLSPPRRLNVYDVPRLEEPLSLICGACGASGRYDVGRVTLDPAVIKASDRDIIQEAVGFTGYFRCRECDAGGPWELPDETSMYITMMGMAAMSGIEDAPVCFGPIATFDNKVFRYATDCEAHLKKLIDLEPERAFLWVRLGNLYNHAGQDKLAKAAYERAIELDPKDIEAHSMFGQILIETGRYLKAVPHFHAVLKHVRDARQVSKKLRRQLARGAIESLLEAHAESNGEIDLLPTMSLQELRKPREDEPVVVELREFDLGTEDGINELCDMFVEPPRRAGWNLLRRRKKPARDVLDDRVAVSIRREGFAVGRNDPCPCGSGRKYKKCCGP